MNRKETTKFLSDLLISEKFSGMGKYWAREVSIDPTRSELSKRVDFMQFMPPGQTTVSAIEKGIFVCYEIKSCKEDVFSGNGLNFIGEKNYIVITMQGYKDILPDYRSGALNEHINKLNGRKGNYGILVAMPDGADPFEEMNEPTPLETKCTWKLSTMIKCFEGLREKSMTELLFCMLRSGKN
nr:MAG TPA: hypothetical protein [Caudoviricetes sp.]